MSLFFRGSGIQHATNVTTRKCFVAFVALLGKSDCKPRTRDLSQRGNKNPKVYDISALDHRWAGQRACRAVDSSRANGLKGWPAAARRPIVNPHTLMVLIGVVVMVTMLVWAVAMIGCFVNSIPSG